VGNSPALQLLPFLKYRNMKATLSAILILTAFSLPALSMTIYKNRGRRKVHQKLILRGIGNLWGCREVDKESPIPPLVISRNRMLVTACSTLYMVNSKMQVIWKWSTGGAGLTDQPIIDSTGTIIVIAFDLIWVGLDSATGEVKWHKDGNGRAVYSQIKRYKGDEYLETISKQYWRPV